MRLKEQKNSGVTIGHLRTWALVCATVGIVGMVIILRGVLGVDAGTTDAKMLELFDNDQTRNLMVAALICQGVNACATVLFSLLLVEGSLHTRDFTKYLMRVGAVALVSEVLFDFATESVFLNLTTLNPVFGGLFSLVMLMFFMRYPDNSAGNIILRGVITLAVLLWTRILHIDEGACVVLMVSVLWNFREKPALRLIFGIVAGLLCWPLFGAFYYVATPLAMILVHFYNGEKGSDFGWGRLVAYPALLLAAGVVRAVVF